MSGRLELYIPEQKKTNSQSHLLQPKLLQAWAEGLPWANVGEISKQVYKGLIEVNRSHLPQKECMVIVELFRKPVTFVTRNLEKHFVDTSFPLSKRHRKIANLTYELNNEMAIAYKIVINQFLRAERLDKSEKTQLVVAIYRAIHYLSKVIIQSALVYETVSPRIWYEIHGLYDYAKRHALEGTNIKTGESDQEESYSTILECYKQVLLFSLASPARLRQRDILQLSLLLKQFGQYAELQKTQKQIDLNNQFLILVDKDSPPVHLSLTKSNVSAPDESQLILDTSELLLKVEELLNGDGEDSEARLVKDRISKKMLRLFIKPWSSAPQRKFVRTRLNFELNVAVGLNSIHSLVEIEEATDSGLSGNLREDMDWLNQQSADEKPMGWDVEGKGITSAFTLAPIDPSLDVRRGDFEAFGPNSRDRSEPDPVVPMWGGLDEQADEVSETYKFRTLNESAGGYCLDWRSCEPSMVKVGELIGIQSPSISGQYGVAVIRWILTQGEQSLQAGVEMLAPNVQPVEMGTDDEYQTCLLLPETSGVESRSSSLITSPHAFQSESTLMINDKQGRRPIKLSRILESTGAFSRYQFTYLDRAEDVAEDDAASFDNIWSTL